MDSHRIAVRYSIVPVTEPLLDEAAYTAALSSDFEKHYAGGRDVWTGEEAMREAPRLLMRALGPVDDAHVLDIGTGHGLDARILLAAGHRVTGVDLVASPAWEEIGTRWPGRAQFTATELTELTEGDFDAALDNGCLHHQHPAGYPRYLARVRELLRPGGVFTVSVFESADGPGRLFANSGNRLYQEFTPAELTALVTAHGFTEVDRHRVPRGTTGLHYLVASYRSTAPRD